MSCCASSIRRTCSSRASAPVLPRSSGSTPSRCDGNPRLVHCSITGFGRTGAVGHATRLRPARPGRGGILSVTGEPERPGVRVGVSLVDQGTAMWAALGVLAALMERERTGEGRALDVSLYETAVAYMGYHVTGYLGSGRVPVGRARAFRRSRRTRSSELQTESSWWPRATTDCSPRSATRSRCPSCLRTTRFTTNPSRVENRDELVRLLSARFSTKDVATWIAVLAEAGVPAAPVQDAGQVAEGEQTAALGILQQLESGAQDRGSAPLGRRCTRDPSPAAARARRGYVGDLAGSRLLRGGDRRPGPRGSR